ncbi:MAG: hypothetical protein ABIE92_02655 [bacterium]
MIKKLTKYIIFLFFIFSLIGCSGYKPFVPPLPVPDDRNPVSKPAFKSAPNDFYDAFNQQFVLQGEQMMDFPRGYRKLTGNPKEAWNADAFGEVPNSSWFTNRNHQKRFPLDQIARGPDTSDGPDASSTWKVVSAKAEGVTPGFTIIDSRGDKYVIKFDPIGYDGLNSGAEVIGSKLFYAAGYNVPENYITFFDTRILKLGDKVKFTDEKGRRRFMNDTDLADILKRIEYQPNGLVRATASKYIEGSVLGPFHYEETRQDDPNDFIPHQHCRELRGLKVLAVWLNHIDAKAANSMDSYSGEEPEGWVKHYLIDFGTILGSGGRGPQPKYRSYENEMDPQALLWRTITLGLYVPGWDKVPKQVDYPCIGRFYSDYYHPEKFKFIFPNPAFDNQTSVDGYWGAKIVMSFTDEQIRAAVEQARYPDPDAAEVLIKTLIERRDITGSYWFTRVAPLDNFHLFEDKNGSQMLAFLDLAVETGLEKQEDSTYRYSVKRNGDFVVQPRVIGSIRVITLPETEAGLAPGDQWEINLQVKRSSSKKYSPLVRIYLVQEYGHYRLLGIQREG